MITQQESKSISSFKVFFCFLIILLHMHYQMPDVTSVSDASGFVFEIQKFIREYVSIFICSIAIPGFAIISGYLFFATADFSKDTYFKKINNRIYTLLIPYIVWNLIVLGGDVVLAFLGRKNLVFNMEWNFWNMLNIFWGIKGNSVGTCPYNGPLWYIRDLFILCLLTPIIYPLLKSKWIKIIFSTALLVTLFADIPYIWYHERIFIVYFCIGGLCAVNQIKLFAHNKGLIVNKLFIIGGIVANLFYFTNYLEITEFPIKYLKHFFVLCVLFAIFSIRLKCLQKENLTRLAAGTFFIYCMHNSFLAVFGPVVQGQCSAVYLVYYLLLPVLDFSFGYALYLGVEKINNPVINLFLLGKYLKKR